jgi:hypothetical protein
MGGIAIALSFSGAVLGGYLVIPTLREGAWVDASFGPALAMLAEAHRVEDSHQLVALGFSQRAAVLLIYAATACLGLGAFSLVGANPLQSVIVLLQLLGIVSLILIMMYSTAPARSASLAHQGPRAAQPPSRQRRISALIASGVYGFWMKPFNPEPSKRRVASSWP